MIYHLKANQFAVFFQYSANFKLTFHVEKGLNQTCFRATVFGDDALCFLLKVSKTFH